MVITTHQNLSVGNILKTLANFLNFVIESEIPQFPQYQIILPLKAITLKLACVAGGIRERVSGRAAFTNPPTASPLVFTASLPKQKHSRARSRQLRRLFWSLISVLNLIKIRRQCKRNPNFAPLKYLEYWRKCCSLHCCRSYIIILQLFIEKDLMTNEPGLYMHVCALVKWYFQQRSAFLSSQRYM